MASDSTNNTLPILKGGKLKWGIYKMRNVLTRTYLDIEEHSRALCSRPAQNLEEGNGMVRLFRWSFVRAFDDHKWEIKPLGRGYSIQRVSVLIHIQAFAFNDGRRRLNQEDLIISAP